MLVGADHRHHCSGCSHGYGGRVRSDPDAREPRAPAIAIWTLSGLIVGVAAGVISGSFLVAMAIFGGLGLLYGVFATRRRDMPEDD